MMQQAAADKEIVICFVPETREDGSCAVTCPDISMLYVVGEDEEHAIRNALAVVEGMFALREQPLHNVRVVREDVARIFDGSEDGSVPAYMVAQLP